MKDTLIFLGWCAALLVISVAGSYVRTWLDNIMMPTDQMTDVQAGLHEERQPEVKTGMPVSVQPVQITDNKE